MRFPGVATPITPLDNWQRAVTRRDDDGSARTHLRSRLALARNRLRSVGQVAFAEEGAAVEVSALLPTTTEHRHLGIAVAPHEGQQRGVFLVRMKPLGSTRIRSGPPETDALAPSRGSLLWNARSERRRPSASITDLTAVIVTRPCAGGNREPVLATNVIRVPHATGTRSCRP